MGKYLFIESRDAFESHDVEQTWNLASQLAGKGSDVTMFLVQNGVLAAREGAQVSTLDAAAGVTVLADDLSLAERGIGRESVRAGVEVAGIDALTDLIMEDGRKPIWT